MKKGLIKTAYTLAVFLLSVLLLSHSYVRRSDGEETMQTTDATLPLVRLLVDDMPAGLLYGYTREMDISHMRGPVLPLGSDRRVSLQLELYETEWETISFEVRTADGSSLVESTEITDYSRENGVLTAGFFIKDLIGYDREYMLVILLKNEEETLRYYTRIVCAADGDRYHAAEELAFVSEFHEKTFDRTQAASLTTYLESDETGDNSSYAYVNIHSDLDQVTWGDLQIVRRTEPEYGIGDLQPETGAYTADYVLGIRGNDGRERSYRVREYYRVRYTASRIYLLDFERRMNYIFEGDPSEVSGDKLSLFMSSPEIPYMESEDGSVFAFVSEGRLYSCNPSKNSITLLFGFPDAGRTDARMLHEGNVVRILKTEADGGIWFLAAGYMNRGKHEGEVGVAVYEYAADSGTIQEQAFLPSTKSEEFVKLYADTLACLNRGNVLYMLLGSDLYAIDSEAHAARRVKEGLSESEYCISDTGRLIAWQEKEDNGRIELLQLDTQEAAFIQQSGRHIRLLGFMGEDIVYGVIYEGDTAPDQPPVYSDIIIEDSDGRILETYAAEGIYVTDIEVLGRQVVLHRAQRDPEGDGFTRISDDQIINTVGTEERNGAIEYVPTQEYEYVTQISMRMEMNADTLRLLKPQEAVRESDSRIELPALTETAADRNACYTYVGQRLTGYYANAAEAIQAADAEAGVAVNNANQYLYVRGNLHTRNQIMSITRAAEGQDYSGKNPVAACLDILLQYEGTDRNTQAFLEQGDTIQEILENNLPQAQILNLEGCTLNTMLYYVNQDIPVLARLRNGGCVLLIGFNEWNTVLFNPSAGTASVYKYGMQDSAALFAENGNQFITYLKPQE